MSHDDNLRKLLAVRGPFWFAWWRFWVGVAFRLRSVGFPSAVVNAFGRLASFRF